MPGTSPGISFHVKRSGTPRPSAAQPSTAAFGFFAYATYDLTNWATLKDWPSTIVFIDLAWGTILSGTVATAGYLIATKVLGLGA